MNLKAVISVVIAAVVVAGAALAAAVVGFFSPAEDDALAYVPRDAAVYGNVFLDPSGSQKLALEGLLEHFPGDGRRDRVIDLLDSVLSETGLQFEEDVEPWLGDQIAFFVQAPPALTETPSIGFLVATTDADRALDAVETAQDSQDAQGLFEGVAYEGARYELGPNDTAIGAIDGFLVVGSEQGFRAVVDTVGGASLEDSGRFKESLEGLSPDRLALFYFDPKRFVDLAEAAGGMAGGGILPGAFPFAGVPQDPVTAIVYARDDGITFESRSSLPEDPDASELARAGARESAPLTLLPQNSFVALGIPELGRTIRQIVDQITETFGAGAGMFSPFGADPLSALSQGFGVDLEDDVLSWMGDAAIFVAASGPGDEGGGVLIKTVGGDASKGLEKIRGALVEAGTPVKRLGLGLGAEGFSVQAPDMPQPVNVFLTDGYAAVVYGDQHSANVVRGLPKLGEGPTFVAARAALGEGFGVGGFVDVEAILRLVSSYGVDSSRVYAEEVEPWLRPFESIVFGTRLEGDRIIGRALVKIR